MKEKQIEGPILHELKYIPTVLGIEKTMRAGTQGRGHDDYAVCVELFKAASGPLAALCWPAWVKFACRLEHPLASKGGVMCDIFKGFGSKTECKNSRGVMIADIPSKQMNSWLRQFLLP